MKEKLYTIPLNDAMNADDECPFCYIERNVEQDIMDYVLGSSASYMETDTPGATDKAGFCRMHYKKMFDYGNTMGNGWILKTHYKKLIAEMKDQFSHFTPGKTSFMDKLKGKPSEENPVSAWIGEKEKSCYICDYFKKEYARYLDTFFYLYKNDSAFREKLTKSKGFCLHHFRDVLNGADAKLNDAEKKEFFPLVFGLMEENMERVSADVDWLIEKFDYRNKDADWKTSKDAVQRGMQKLKGGYPADPVYKMNK